MKDMSASNMFFALLAVLFIGLKLIGAVQWSWWWVLAPIWIPFVVSIGVIALIIIIGLLIKK